MSGPGLVLNAGCGERNEGDVKCDLALPRSNLTDFVMCDGHALPFAGNKFSKVLSGCVIEHSLNPYTMLGEMVRVLSSGGSLYLDTDNPSYWRFHIAGRFRIGIDHAFGFGEEYGHHMIFFPGHIIGMLKKLNMEVKTVSYSGSITYDRLFAKLPLMSRFFKRFYSIISVKKSMP
jgi:ubiquinone/menaquinone biosynthesis C-methylase UbiE